MLAAMTKPYRLRDKMSPERRARVDASVAEILRQLSLDSLPDEAVRSCPPGSEARHDAWRADHPDPQP